MTPFPFLVGCGRSGTTLLRAMFDSHPQMAIPDEVGFIVRYQRPHYAMQYGWPRRFDANACADLILADASFRRWGLDETKIRAAIASDPPPTFADVIRRLYSLMAEARGKPRYGDKTPIHVLHMARLVRLFPESRFVHIVRDGRDVALSYQSVAWGPSSASEAAVRWRRCVRRGRHVGERLGPLRYREVRYEELVADPEPILQELCGFLDLDWDDCMLRYSDRAPEVIASTRFPDAHRRLLLPPTPGLRDWRRDMPAIDVARFEAIAGDELDAFGYGRTLEAPSTKDQLGAHCEVIAARASEVWAQTVAGTRVVVRHALGR